MSNGCANLEFLLQNEDKGGVETTKIKTFCNWVLYVKQYYFDPKKSHLTSRNQVDKF